MKTTIWLAVVIVALQLSGCVLGTRKVELFYPPEQQSVTDAPDEAAVHSSSFSGSELRLEVNDVRADKLRVGNLRNTYGMDTADVVATNSVQDWAHEALVYELGRRGIRVVAGSTVTSASGLPQLVVDVQKAYCDVYAFYDAEVTLNGGFWYGDQLSATAVFPVQVNSGMSVFGTGESIAASLALALQQAIEQMLTGLGIGSELVQTPAAAQ